MRCEAVLKKKHYNCFENMIYNLSNLYNYECHYMFMNSWDFYYCSAPKIPIDEGLDFNSRFENIDVRQIELLSKYHGLSIQWINGSDADVDSLLKMIRHKDTAIIVEMDIQYVRWSSLGAISNVNHYYLITYLEELNNFFYIDGYFTSDLQEFDKKDVKYIKRIGLIYKTSIVSHIPDFIETAVYVANNYKREKSGECSSHFIRLFAHDLLDPEKYENIHRPNKIKTATLSRKISYIINGRQNAHEMFKCIECDTQRYKDFILLSLKDVLSEWDLINNLIIKWLYQNKFSILQFVSNKLLEIASLEQSLVDKMLFLARND